MAEIKTGGEIARGEYVIGIAVILAALLVSATIYMSAGNLSDSLNSTISKKDFTVNVQGGAGNGGNTGGNGGTTPPPAAVQGDWSWVASAPGIGPKDAKVTVVEFADYQCPFCGIVWGRTEVQGQDITTRFASILGTATKIENEYAKTGKVRFVFKPMAFLGQESIDSANAAYCARELGGDEGYFKMYNKLFSAQGDENAGVFSKANLKTLATEAGFDSAKMASCIDSGKYASQVEKDSAEANGVGVSGTPSFALNNKVVQGGAEYTTLKAAIEAALKAS